MKALFVAAVVASTLPLHPASASIVTVVGSFAQSCYQAAAARASTDVNLALCDRALAEQPLDDRDRLATFVNRGILKMARGDLAGARKDYNRAAIIDSGEAEVWLNMGVLRYTQGNSADAIRMFERAIRQRTRSPAFAYYGRGLAHEDRGNLKSAYADYLRARALKPDWPEPRNELQRFAVRRD
jgi:tetratricopeptide (TPR) repeat protein